MSLDYAADVNAVTLDISVIRQQMGCDFFNMPVFEGKFQEKDKDYKLSVDTLALLVHLENKYRS